MPSTSNTGADTQAFSYDHLNRLLTAVATGGVANYTHSYTYNQIGNITNFNGAAYTYSSAHKHAVATANGVTYSYDANGNMTFRNASGTANDFAQAFDVENRLITVTNAANVSTFAYDAAGIRVKSVDPDGLITYYPFPVYEEEVWPVATTPPTVNLTANGQTALTVYPNTTFTLQWNTVSAFRCEASGNWSGEKSTTGSEVIAGFATGSRTYLLTCHNSAGSTSQAVTVTVDNSPAVTLTANGVTNLALTPGTGFTLAWSSSSATTCAASGNWSGNKPTSGSQSMSGFTSGSRTYTLACSNSYGTTTRSVVVVIVPAVTLTANGVTNLVLQPGTGFTLAWSSSSATACAASGDWSGNKPTSGSQSMSGFTSGSRTYTLACSNSYGTTTRSVVVTIFETNPCPGGICTEAALMSGGLLAVTEVQTAVQRSTYTVAGQTIAIRITGDWRTTRNGLYYLYADHLGSASLVADSNAAVVAGSTARYTPFGGWRTEPTAGLTDRGYTGHMHNNLGTGAEDIGLVYMAARWYSPTLGRFISADTIVPNPANPQSLNRYSYVRNSPLNMTDPTGHYEADCENNACGKFKPFSSPYLRFSGTGLDRETKQLAHQAASAIADRMATAVNSMRRFEARINGEGSYTHVTATEAFRGVFGGSITVHGANQACSVATDCRAWASLTEKIISVGTDGVTNHYLFIHEIFHVFDYVILKEAGQTALSAEQKSDASFPNRPDTGATQQRWGFAGGNFSEWQKSRSGDPDEEFADMGIGWTYNRWDTLATGDWSDYGKARANFMDVNMGIWLSQLLP